MPQAKNSLTSQINLSGRKMQHQDMHKRKYIASQKQIYHMSITRIKNLSYHFP